MVMRGTWQAVLQRAVLESELDDIEIFHMGFKFYRAYIGVT